MNKNTFTFLNRYRYTLDELATLLAAVKARAECYDSWVDKVKAALAAKDDDRLEFSELKDLLEEANERKYPASDLLEGLTLTVEEAEKCQTVANQLGSKKVGRLTLFSVSNIFRGQKSFFLSFFLMFHPVHVASRIWTHDL